MQRFIHPIIRTIVAFVTVFVLVFGNAMIAYAQTPNTGSGTQCMLQDGSMNGVLTSTGCVPRTGPTGLGGAAIGGALSVFKPGTDYGTGASNSFNGTSFTSVGGAVAGCANIGGGLTRLSKSLFGKTTSPDQDPMTQCALQDGSMNGLLTAQGCVAGNTVTGAGTQCMLQDGSMNGILTNAGCVPKTDRLVSLLKKQPKPYTNPSSVGNITNAQNASVSAVPVSDLRTQQAAEAAKANSDKMLNIDQCLNGVAYASARFVLQQVQSKTINWINTGLNGNPLYVTNLPSYLKGLRDTEVSKYLTTVRNSDPVFGGLIQNVILQTTTAKTDAIIDKYAGTKSYPYTYAGLSCSIDYSARANADYASCIKSATSSPSTRALVAEQCKNSVTARYTALAKTNCITDAANKYNNFMQNFSSGGWNALLDSSNNPINAIFNATDALTRNIQTAQQNTRDELQRGNGFLDFKQCVRYAETTTNGITSVGGVSGDRGLSGEATCLEYATVTPGSVIAAQAANIATSSARQLENADQINETLGAFFDQLLNKLFSSGIAGLSGGYGAGAGVELAGITTEDPVANALGYQTALSGFTTVDFDISRPQQLRTIIKTQKDFLNRSLDAQSVMDRIVPTLGALDYCIPGPNPDWQNGLDANFNAYINSFTDSTQASTSGSGIGNSIGSIGGAIGASAALAGTALGATLGSAVPIIGTLIGGLLGGLIGGLFGSKPDQAYVVQPTLYDKTIGEAGVVSPLYYDLGIKSLPLGELIPAIKSSFASLKQHFATTYSTANIMSMFAGTVPQGPRNTQGTGLTCGAIDSANYVDCCVNSAANFRSCLNYCGERGMNDVFLSPVIDPFAGGQPSGTIDSQCVNTPPVSYIPPPPAAATPAQIYSDGFVVDSLAETKKLSQYNQAVIVLDAQYETQKTDTEGAIAELESIYAEVNDIVETAKTRYVDDMATNGTPVNLACLNKAYIIDRSTILGDPTVEPSTIDPIVQQSNESKIYFYTHL